LPAEGMSACVELVCCTVSSIAFNIMAETWLQSAAVQ